MHIHNRWCFLVFRIYQSLVYSCDLHLDFSYVHRALWGITQFMVFACFRLRACQRTSCSFWLCVCVFPVC